jgi:hypothetical protein
LTLDFHARTRRSRPNIGTYPNCVSDRCALLDCNNHASQASGTRTQGYNLTSGLYAASCEPIWLKI